MEGMSPATDLRYPIGKFQRPDHLLTDDEIRSHVLVLSGAPEDFREAVQGLSDAQLDTPYRAGGWSVRQVIHHLADSHMNAYTRVKLALTESSPTIKTYDEKAWAELADSRLPVEISLILLDALHRRWVSLLDSLQPSGWERTFLHPDHGRPMRLDEATAMYSWHCRHHTSHITALRDREGW
jgi:hypothetical protein